MCENVSQGQGHGLTASVPECWRGWCCVRELKCCEEANDSKWTAAAVPLRSTCSDVVVPVVMLLLPPANPTPLPNSFIEMAREDGGGGGNVEKCCSPLSDVDIMFKREDEEEAETVEGTTVGGGGSHIFILKQLSSALRQVLGFFRLNGSYLAKLSHQF